MGGMGCDWVAGAVEMRPVADITPYERNARTHSPEQVAQIAASIEEYGWTNPLLIEPNGRLIAGHGRLLAAQSLGLQQVECKVINGWDPVKVRAYVIADNKLAENAGWDGDILAVELAALADEGYDLELTGFSDDELSDLLDGLGDEGESETEDVPEPPTSPVTLEGDVWQLGAHRVMCGDSTQAHVVENLLNAEKPHLMVTDPPYGVEYNADWRNKAIRSDGTPSNGRAIGTVKNDDNADWREAWALFPGDVAYVWHAGIYAGIVLESLESSGFEIRSQIIWAKTRFAISRGHYHWQHEPCWYAVKKGATGHWNGGRDQTTLWEIDHQKSETGHSTQKPLEAMLRPILNNSKRGDAVYDPFLGSGTTLIACEKESRRCFGVELSPAYGDVIVKRWQEFTGQAATLEGDGRTFDEIAAERQLGEVAA